MRIHPACVSALLLLTIPACRVPRDAQPPWTTTGTGLGYADLVPGQGSSPTLGQVCTVEVRGWVEEAGGRGRSFLDTRRRGYPDTFPLGVGRVIKGWDEGVATMKPGGRRLLRVPPALGYSAGEAGSDIPAGSTLLFEIELIAVR